MMRTTMALELWSRFKKGFCASLNCRGDFEHSFVSALRGQDVTRKICNKEKGKSAAAKWKQNAGNFLFAPVKQRVIL
jgi:hypothetical protein